MKTLIVLLVSSILRGSSPWCVATQNGSLYCYYTNYNICLMMCQANPLCATCVPNPERN